MLCGISSRFQLLSPTERQVLHALLTRSPLSNPRRSYPVRLACVRHAASVRPEPGSNSQKIVSKALSRFKSFSESLLLAINSRIFVGCFRLRFKQIHKFVKGVLFVFALFNLQGTAASRCAVSSLILSRALSLVKPFLHFLASFFKGRGPLSRVVSAPFLKQPAYITTRSPRCQVLF